MPVIHVEMWPGRTVAQKKELAKAITDAMVRIISWVSSVGKDPTFTGPRAARILRTPEPSATASSQSGREKSIRLMWPPSGGK